MTAPRFVTLRATDKRIPLGAYVLAVRTAKAAPDVEFRHGLCTWWPVKGSKIVAEFRAGLVDRINRHDPTYGHGRKWADDWQGSARRVSRQLQARIITCESECPPGASPEAHKSTLQTGGFLNVTLSTPRMARSRRKRSEIITAYRKQ